jgi:Ca-activated chloride channel homolog
MNLTSGFGDTEKWFLSLFFMLYLIYLGRIFWIARRLDASAGLIIFKFVLRTIYFSLLLLALLNPSFGELKGTVKAQGKDIFLLIDISKSMDATDIQPSRLEKVKFEIDRFVQHFQNDRIGLIVFSEEAFMLSPLTFDKNAINLFLPKINTKLLPSGGTDFNPPLELAVNKLSKSMSKNQSKVIILISDGENFGNEDKELTNKIKQKNIKLLSVGVGTNNGITIRDGKNFIKDNNGNVVVTKLESGNLKNLASTTRGEYFEISTLSDSFNELIKSVDNLEDNLIDERQIEVIANKYFYFLIIALFLLGIDVFFTIRTFQL